MFLVAAGLRAQEQRTAPSFTGLSTPATTSPADAALNSGLSVYREGAELHADVATAGGNLEPGDVFYARPERYPWRLAAVINIEFTTYLQKMGRQLRQDVGDLETLEPATIDYLKNSIPAELSARMQHIIMEQQLLTGRYRLLAFDPVGSGGPAGQQQPQVPYFYTDGAGALEVVRRLGQTLEMSLLSREQALYDLVTAALLSKASPVRQALGHLLDPAHFPPDPKQEDIITRLGKEGLPRIVVGVGGYTIGALGILAYSLTKHGLLGYDLDFNRITLSSYLFKTDKYGFGWRIDTSDFGFDNAHAGLELSTRQMSVSVLAGGKVLDSGGHLFAKPETTFLGTYKLFDGGAKPGDVSSALALLVEAHVPWGQGQARLGAGLMYDAKLPAGPGEADRRLILDGRAEGAVSDLDWRLQGTYRVQKKDNAGAWFIGAGVGNEKPIPERTLNQYDSRRFGGPPFPSQVYGYGFFGLNF